MSDSIIVRLRRANPVPEVATAPGMELFARITALPGDSRLVASERRPKGHRAIVLAFTVLAAVVLASTAYAISHWLGGDAVSYTHLTLPTIYSV